MDAILEIGLSNAAAALILAILAFAVGRFCRRPALVHGLWLLVFIKLVTPPLFRVPVVTLPATNAGNEAAPVAISSPPITLVPQIDSLPPGEDAASAAVDTPPPSEPLSAAAVAPPAALEPGAPADQDPAPTASDGAIRWSTWLMEHWQWLIMTIWLAGATALLGLTTMRAVCFHRLLRFARPAPEQLVARVGRLAKRLDLYRWPDVRVVAGPLSPLLWAMFGKPYLLLPEQLLVRLSDHQLAALLIHELAHYRRGDHWVRWLELAASCLYWWHPAVWWAKRGLREAEEECCDAWVVWALPDAARTYALALVKTVDYLSEFQPPLPAGASGLGHIRHLKRRITMIMKGKTPRSLTWAGSLGLCSAALVLLPWLPTWAQDRAPQPPGGSERREREQANPEREAQVAQTRETIQKLSEQMNRLGEEMRRLSEQMERAHRVLAELEGRPVERRDDGGRGDRAESGRDPRGDGNRFGPGGPRFTPPAGGSPPGTAPGTPGFPAQPGQPGMGGGFGRGGFGGGGAFGGGGFPGGMAPMANIEQRLSELERKINRLTEMMERSPQPGRREEAPRNRGPRGEGDGERRERATPVEAPAPPDRPPGPGGPGAGPVPSAGPRPPVAAPPTPDAPPAARPPAATP